MKFKKKEEIKWQNLDKAKNCYSKEDSRVTNTKAPGKRQNDS